MEMMALALEVVVVRVNCLIVAAAVVVDADIVVGESKRGEDMDYDLDDDGLGNDDWIDVVVDEEVADESYCCIRDWAEMWRQKLG